MNEELIGESVTVEATDSGNALELVVGLIRDLLVAADAQPDDLGAIESELGDALRGLQAEDGSVATITAELVLVAAGIEVRLCDSSGETPAQTVLCPA